jgi:hypothetical protein
LAGLQVVHRGDQHAADYNKAKAAWLVQQQAIVDYINCEKDLFERKFVVFVNNDAMTHWSLTVAIHPGLVKNVDGMSLCGFLHVDTLCNAACDDQHTV